MSQPIAKVIRQADARNFMEALEHCRECVRTPKMWLGTSTLLPGQRGAIDPGHPASHETFFVCQGDVLLYDEARYYELSQGDAIFIPQGTPHNLINVGETTAIVVWAGGPDE